MTLLSSILLQPVCPNFIEIDDEYWIYSKQIKKDYMVIVKIKVKQSLTRILKVMLENE